MIDHASFSTFRSQQHRVHCWLFTVSNFPTNKSSGATWTLEGQDKKRTTSMFFVIRMDEILEGKKKNKKTSLSHYQISLWFFSKKTYLNQKNKYQHDSNKSHLHFFIDTHKFNPPNNPSFLPSQPQQNTNKQNKHKHKQTNTNNQHKQTQTQTNKQTNTNKHKQTQTNTNKHKHKQTNTNKHKQTNQDAKTRRSSAKVLSLSLSLVLFCIVLYCIVLYCIVLYCIVLYCIVLFACV